MWIKTSDIWTLTTTDHYSHNIIPMEGSEIEGRQTCKRPSPMARNSGGKRGYSGQKQDRVAAWKRQLQAGSYRSNRSKYKGGGDGEEGLSCSKDMVRSTCFLRHSVEEG
jgi:hypothetical protein